MIQEITREEIKIALAENSITLIEALPEKYFKHGHLPSAIQINHDEIQSRAPGLLPNKHSLIVTYCASSTCQNSAYAAEHLVAMGYSNVRKYTGGKQDWVESGELLEEVCDVCSQ